MRLAQAGPCCRQSLLRTQRAHPGMATFRMNFLGGSGKVRISERAGPDSHHIGFARRLPEHRRPAIATEVKRQSETGIRLSVKGFVRPQNIDVCLLEERGDPICGTRSFLAGKAVTQGDQFRLTMTQDFQIAAGTGCLASQYDPL